jgi:transcriptional regulator with XRE-family HTH domain
MNTDIVTKGRREQIVEARFDAPVPDLIRLFYVQDGLSQDQLAEKLGVSRGTVIDWMKKYGIPTRDRRAVPSEGAAA